MSKRVGGGDQIVPSVGRIAAFEPGSENDIGVGPGAGLAQGVFVIGPGVDDDPMLGVEAIEHTESAEELGPSRVPVCRPESIAELVLLRVGMGRALEQFGFGMADVSLRIGAARKAGWE